MNVQQWFRLGMKREIPELLPVNLRVAFDLGAGKNPVPGCAPLDEPKWRATLDPIPCPDGGATAIFAHHFLEHLRGTDAVAMLRECERALAPGGTLNIVVPYYRSQLACQDLDHKSQWCEDTLRVLFGTPYYEKNRERPWTLQVHACFIIGIVERNLALFTQLVKRIAGNIEGTSGGDGSS